MEKLYDVVEEKKNDKKVRMKSLKDEKEEVHWIYGWKLEKLGEKI